MSLNFDFTPGDKNQQIPPEEDRHYYESDKRELRKLIDAEHSYIERTGLTANEDRMIYWQRCSMYKDRIAQYEKQHGGTSYASKSRKDDDDNETGVWPFANWDLSEPDEAAGTPNNGWNPFEGNKSSLSGRPSGWSLGDGPAAFQLWDDTSNETDGAPSPRNGNPWDPPVAESNPNLTKSKEHSSTAKRNRRTESDRVKFSTNPRNTRSHDWSSYHNNRQDTSPGGENDLWRTFDSSHRTTTAKSGNNYGIGLRPVCSRLAHGTALPPPATLKLQQMCQRCEET